MGKVLMEITMSLDGYTTGPEVSAEEPFGRGGERLAPALLRDGLMDEMEIHLVPVLLGEGRRLFDHLGGDHIELDLVRRLEDRDVTHLRYHVRHPRETA